MNPCITAPGILPADAPTPYARAFFELTMLDGRDGLTRWTWRGGDDLVRRDRQPRALRLADFDGNGACAIRFNVAAANGRRRIVVLDALGRESVQHEIGPAASSSLESTNIDRDGREELLGQSVGRPGPHFC